MTRKRGAESPSESVPSKSRWESDDDDDDSDSDHPSSRASTRTKLTHHHHHHDEEEKVRQQSRRGQARAVGTQARPVLVSCELQQPPARAVKKHVHWGTPEVHIAIFDEGDGIGFIRLASWRRRGGSDRFTCGPAREGSRGQLPL